MSVVIRVVNAPKRSGGNHEFLESEASVANAALASPRYKRGGARGNRKASVKTGAFLLIRFGHFRTYFQYFNLKARSEDVQEQNLITCKLIR